MRALLGALAVLGLIAALAAGCGGSTSTTQTTSASSTTEDTGSAQTGAAETSEPEQTSAQPGGIYRIGVEEGFNFTNAFDPTGEYNLDAIGLYSNLLVRTLLGYRHVEGAEGSELVPDLAAALPEVSSDGLTWTFTLKDGVTFGPPLSREITSADVAYAFERIGTPDLAAQYGFYYDVIDGMTEFRDGSATTIAGIETPDDRTIVFHLTEPAGDFGFRLAMPAAGAVPEEVAGCFEEAGAYGRNLVSSGPYMIEGSDEVDASSCETLTPASGFDPETTLSLVRNPDYDPATDDPEARQSLPDGFLLTVNANTGDIFAKIAAGELEGEWATAPPKTLEAVLRGPRSDRPAPDQLRRLDGLCLAEPDATSVRRRTREAGREPRRGQGRDAPRLGRRADRRDRDPHLPGRHARRPSRRIRPLPQPGLHRRRRRREGRDGAIRVRRRRRRRLRLGGMYGCPQRVGSRGNAEKARRRARAVVRDRSASRSRLGSSQIRSRFSRTCHAASR